MTARRSLALFRLWAFVLLATIGLQAMSPVPTPLQRESGSAFSASTAEVALDSHRRGDVVKAEAVPMPPLLTRVPSPNRLSTPAQSIVSTPHLRPAVRGPPPRRSPERLPDLRGPPLT